ncbi:hypothetical protein H6F90_00585 [Trichocoleus sp. FACHB-591]|uniref:hypothetical protein n=1 Tax=Trichocoleus sp. FACHB-591 TaxID=2692872 RepID=UPI0016872685|nr:hypothetical protein [Trichocoleus sp. FACHB-591]MBD2093651.1 hypothetical protein [Trichocoleus sp. FACHB-591]
MSKKKHKQRNKKNQTSSRNDSNSLVFKQLNNPFSGLPQEVIAEILVDAGRSYEREFNESLAELVEKISSVDVLHLLSILTAYGLSVGMDEAGKTVNKKNPTIHQSHVELVQALALRLPPSEQSSELVKSEQVQEVWDLLISFDMAFNLKRLVQIQNAKTEEKKAILHLQEWLRIHTNIVRNWGYFKRVISISKRLYSELDPLFKASVGLEATSIIDVFEYLVIYCEEVINERFHKMKRVFKARNIEEAIKTYHEMYQLPDSIEEAAALLREQGAKLEEVRFLILSHSDLFLVEAFSFTVEELGSEMNIETIALETVLSRLSYQFGELKDANPEHFFLGNPVWTKPLIKLPTGNYFCVVPQVFFSFVFQTLDSLLSTEEVKSEVQDKRRSKFLEDEIKKLFIQAFPQSTFKQNFKWKESDVEYETDFLMQVDSYLLIIEAKSGAVSRAALRGATGSAKDDIEELLISPAIQSKRFADRIIELKANQIFPEAFQALTFDLTAIQKIIRLSVTLEDFATIQSQVSRIRDTGWVDKDFSTTPTIALADLEIIFDVLPFIPQKIHYLIRRAELEEHMQYRGDELDLLGFYLRTGFNLGKEEFEPREWIISGMSEKVDRYYVALDRGITRAKPRLELIKWWEDIQLRIEQRCPYRWLEVAVMLLNVSLSDQRKAEREFKRIIRNVRKNWRQPGHVNSIIVDLPQRREAIGLLAFRKFEQDQRREFMNDLAGQSFSETDAERCLVIGVNIDDQDWYPYSLLGVFQRHQIGVIES